MIYHIKAAPTNKAAQAIAAALRTSQIANGAGALLLQPDLKEHAVEHQIEKIIAEGGAHEPGKAAAKVNWKPETAIVLIGKDTSILKAFDEATPGFSKHFGPVTTLTIG